MIFTFNYGIFSIFCVIFHNLVIFAFPFFLILPKYLIFLVFLLKYVIVYKIYTFFKVILAKLYDKVNIYLFIGG